MDGRVKSVEEGSAAWEGGVEPGDILRKINHHKIKDIFDYRFYSAEECVLLEMETAAGEIYDVEIEKDPYEDLGIEFENPLLDRDRGCANRCIFCFIDQLPPNMRETMYFKDDDTRLSFLTGNYVTLTNVGYRELERLVKYKMSPINLSVHTTNPKLRCFMLGNKKAGDIMEKARFLADGGIQLNGQIVLVPDVNDGAELERTVRDLMTLSDQMVSVSVVPIGITKYREGLYPARAFTEEECRKVIRFVEGVQKEARKTLGRNFLYAADEFYITAGENFPSSESYDDFPQLENGVGMCSLLESSVQTFLQEQKQNLKRHFTGEKKISVSIATGKAAYAIIKELAAAVTAEFPHVTVTVYEIINCFFGENVTVSGLITGGDLRSQLADKQLGDVLLIPQNMLRAGEPVFLDDVTLDALSADLGIRICPIGEAGADFVLGILSGGGMLDIKNFRQERYGNENE